MLGQNRKHNAARFTAGDMVRVRSAETISRTLDSLNRLDGCLFVDQMWEYCGRKFKILKVVHNLFDEQEHRMYKARLPLYILEGLLCHGEVYGVQHRCDRSCYLLWREEWLEKP